MCELVIAKEIGWINKMIYRRFEEQICVHLVKHYDYWSHPLGCQKRKIIDFESVESSCFWLKC